MRKLILLAFVLLAWPLASRAQGGGIAPFVATYSARGEFQGQPQDLGTREITVADSVAGGAGVWVVVNRMTVSGQPGIDSVVMARGSLAPLSRHAVLGLARLTLDLQDSVLTGHLKAGPQVLPLSFRPGERSFLNYYALRTALRDWPVTAGWRGTAAILELLGRAELTQVTMEVTGEEKITVPAGEFDCWVVHVTGSAIDERWWVSKAGHHVVRTREPVGRAGAIMQLDLVSLAPAP
ncbi:MAG TPA: hypothetical protein VJT67_15485 [Longimicrobiaceae bacterium]|nr:hypothetical protein [Longimicrobiaceae bacterium]